MTQQSLFLDELQRNIMKIHEKKTNWRGSAQHRFKKVKFWFVCGFFIEFFKLFEYIYQNRNGNWNASFFKSVKMYFIKLITTVGQIKQCVTIAMERSKYLENRSAHWLVESWIACDVELGNPETFCKFSSNKNSNSNKFDRVHCDILTVIDELFNQINEFEQSSLLYDDIGKADSNSNHPRYGAKTLNAFGSRFGQINQIQCTENNTHDEVQKTQ